MVKVLTNIERRKLIDKFSIEQGFPDVPHDDFFYREIEKLTTFKYYELGVAVLAFWEEIKKEFLIK